MTEARQDLSTISLFEDLSSAEIAAVSKLARPVRWQAGDDIYSLGDPGGSMFAVLQGAVEIFSVVSGIEKHTSEPTRGFVQYPVEDPESLK